MLTIKTFDRCSKIVNSFSISGNVTTIPTCITETDRVTFPPNVISPHSYEMAWYCKHIYYISDIHLAHKVALKFKKGATDEQIERYIRRLARELLTKEIRENIFSYEGVIILFGGDISSDFELAKIFYTEFMKYWNKEFKNYYNSNSYVYAILGNHEFWSFNSINECYEAYVNLFESLHICFLNNTFTWFGKPKLPKKRIQNENSLVPQYIQFKREEDEEEYDYQMQHLHNIVIVGGVGFAGYNKEFNANMNIYQGSIKRDEEILLTRKWEEVYSLALQHAKELNCLLIVLTHNPLCDWKGNGIEDQNCIYINGHNHRNYLHHDDEHNIHIFADNQIGYYASKIQFKEAFIYDRFNPFAMLDDGYHEIASSDYLRFYDFMQEKISGNGLVERLLKTQNAHFYMIKHKGFYGFFVISPKGAYICAGGNVKKISKCNDIEQFNKDFFLMIQKYLKILSPYRNAQEQISEAVKSFGGEGTIHGCIIDIDFYNHIMLNPTDGSITYYYSPMFGTVEKHSTLLSLLNKHNKLLAEQYRKQVESQDYNIVHQNELISGKMEKLDIKNSLYTVSNRMNQLQRLFDKKILREWNESLLQTEYSIEELSLPSKTKKKI